MVVVTVADYATIDSRPQATTVPCFWPTFLALHSGHFTGRNTKVAYMKHNGTKLELFLTPTVAVHIIHQPFALCIPPICLLLLLYSVTRTSWSSGDAK